MQYFGLRHNIDFEGVILKVLRNKIHCVGIVLNGLLNRIEHVGTILKVHHQYIASEY